jgi:hypothetical protein
MSISISLISWLAQEHSHLILLSPNHQTLTHVSLYAWMKHEDWKLLHHPKGKIKVIYNSILSCIPLISLIQFCGFLQEWPNPSLTWKQGCSSLYLQSW